MEGGENELNEVRNDANLPSVTRTVKSIWSSDRGEQNQRFSFPKSTEANLIRIQPCAEPHSEQSMRNPALFCSAARTSLVRQRAQPCPSCARKRVLMQACPRGRQIQTAAENRPSHFPVFGPHLVISSSFNGPRKCLARAHPYYPHPSDLVARLPLSLVYTAQSPRNPAVPFDPALSVQL